MTKIHQRSVNSLEDTVNNSDFLFISVPTPSKKNGDIDLTILKNCLNEISETVGSNHSPIVLVRSTVVPELLKVLKMNFQI